MSELLFFLKAVVKTLVLPPAGNILLVAAGLASLKRFPRAGRVCAWVGLVSLYAVSTPFVSAELRLLLDVAPPLDIKRAAEAQAIVILGGGLRRNAAEYGGDTLGPLTLDRVRYGAWVARRTGLPVLVTGGAYRGTEAEATLMKRSLENEFGVPVRWSEPRARDTHENAVFSAALLKPAGVTRIVLVAHSFDMPRAIAEFKAAGLEVTPAPTQIPNDGSSILGDFLPRASALQGSYYAIYEMLANVPRLVGLGP